MKLTWLAPRLRAAGLTVVEEPGWEARGDHWPSGAPIGAMQHHTAAPVPFPVTRLYSDGRIKCNLNTKPDGTVHLVAAGRTNYSSGKGSGTVRDETMNDTAPSGMALARGLRDTTNGNLWYINNEADHYGDGRSIPTAQERSLITSWRVIFDHMQWSPNRLIGHAEWTRRKIDPRWDGRTAHQTMNRMRALIGGAAVEEEDHMYPIRRGDGADDQRPERREDVRHYQAKLKTLGRDVGDDGIADQQFLDAIFAIVGSPLGGSYFSGQEAAAFDQTYIEHLTAGGLRSGDTVRLVKGT